MSTFDRILCFAIVYVPSLTFFYFIARHIANTFVCRVSVTSKSRYFVEAIFSIFSLETVIVLSAIFIPGILEYRYFLDLSNPFFLTLLIVLGIQLIVSVFFFFYRRHQIWALLKLNFSAMFIGTFIVIVMMYIMGGVVESALFY